MSAAAQRGKFPPWTGTASTAQTQQLAQIKRLQDFLVERGLFQEYMEWMSESRLSAITLREREC